MNPATAPLETDAAALGYQPIEAAPTSQTEVVSLTGPDHQLLNDPGKVAAVPPLTVAPAPGPEVAAAPASIESTPVAAAPPSAQMDELPTVPSELEAYLYGRKP